MKPKTMFRQGDVLVVLTAVAALPAGAKEVQPEKGRRIVLAHGEVTGHAHAIHLDQGAGASAREAVERGYDEAAADARGAVRRANPPVRYFDANAERYLQVLEKVSLTHEERGAIVLDKGTYRQAFQVEDFGEEVRRVAD